MVMRISSIQAFNNGVNGIGRNYSNVIRTQEQISTRRAEVAASRATLRQELAQDKAACYARFLVNRCLRQHQDAFTQRDHVYQLQDIELNRQERALKDIDTQLRLQHKAAQAAAQTASSSTAP